MAMLPVVPTAPSTESYKNPNEEDRSGSSTSYQSSTSISSRREGGATNDQTPNLTRTRPNTEDSFKQTLKKKQQLQADQDTDSLPKLQTVAQAATPPQASQALQAPTPTAIALVPALPILQFAAKDPAATTLVAAQPSPAATSPLPLVAAPSAAASVPESAAITLQSNLASGAPTAQLGYASAAGSQVADAANGKMLTKPVSPGSTVMATVKSLAAGSNSAVISQAVSGVPPAQGKSDPLSSQASSNTEADDTAATSQQTPSLTSQLLQQVPPTSPVANQAQASAAAKPTTVANATSQPAATSIAKPAAKSEIAVSLVAAHSKLTDSRSDSGSKSSSNSNSNSQGSPQGNGALSNGAATSSPQILTQAQDVKVAQAGPDERIAVIQQITDHAVALNSSASISPAAQHSVTINVSPEHWGDLKISLTMPSAEAASSGAGVSATITAQSGAVRDALDAQVKDLRQALQSAGVRVDKLEVIVAANAATAAPRASSESGFQQNSGFNQPQHGQASGSGLDTNSQGSKQNQQFSSMFGDSSSGGSNRNAATWLPAVSPELSAAEADPETLAPISIVDATSANFYNSRGMNVLA